MGGVKFGALIVETVHPSFFLPRHGGKKIKEFARQFPSQVDLSVRFFVE
jgi:Flp pilus assembly protein TadB